jgi:fluoride exporter
VFKLLLIAVGGSAGALARYFVSGGVQGLLDRTQSHWAFPWGTMVVNITGCLVMGLLAPLLFERARPEIREMILIGFLGAYTTWSSFGYETIRFLDGRQYMAAAIYVLGTNLCCLVAVLIGFRWMTRFIGGS